MAKNLIARRVTVLSQPVVKLAIVPYCKALFIASTGDMVNAEELPYRLAAAGAPSSAISIKSLLPQLLMSSVVIFFPFRIICPKIAHALPLFVSGIAGQFRSHPLAVILVIGFPVFVRHSQPSFRDGVKLLHYTILSFGAVL